MIVDQKPDVRKSIDLDEDEKSESWFMTQVQFKVNFIEMQFTFTYVGLREVVAKLGNITGLIEESVEGMAAWLLLAFIFELVMLIRMKNKWRL